MSKLEDICYHMYESSGNSKYVLAGRKPIGPDEAKDQIKLLMLELIGEDEEPGRTMGPGMPSFQRDMLRRELRSKVELL